MLPKLKIVRAKQQEIERIRKRNKSIPVKCPDCGNSTLSYSSFRIGCKSCGVYWEKDEDEWIRAPDKLFLSEQQGEAS